LNYAACESNSTGDEAFFRGADDFIDSELWAAAKIDGLRGFMKLDDELRAELPGLMT